jgi:hypothetical protein
VSRSAAIPRVARRLQLELGPSAFLAVAIVAAHAMAALCVAAVLPGAAGLAAAAALAIWGVAAAWRRALLRAGSSLRGLEVDGEKLEVRLTGGAAFAAELSERRYVGPYLVVLRLRRPVRRTLLITRDMLDEESFRRLRIWALWGRLPAVATKQLAA